MNEDGTTPDADPPAPPVKAARPRKAPARRPAAPTAPAPTVPAVPVVEPAPNGAEPAAAAPEANGAAPAAPARKAAAPRKAPVKRAPAKRAPARPPAAQVAEAVAAPEPVAVPDPAVTDAAPAPEPVAVRVPVVIKVPKPVKPKQAARLAVRLHLATHAAALLEQEPRVRHDEHDSVHKMRVAARRLRSGLRTFRPLLDAEWARGLSEELRWLASSLGAARDREVLLARLERDIAALPPWAAQELTLAAVRTELGKALEAARGDALEALDSPRYAALVAALAEAAEDPPTTAAAGRPCAKAVPPLVARSFKRLADEAKALRLEPVTPDTDDAWHEARISAKKARYAAEACVPVFGKPAARMAEQLTRVTELLGEHQDAAVAAEAVVEIGQLPTVPAQAALSLGVLHGVQREAVRAARTEFLKIWPDVSDKRWRSWL